MNGQEQKPRPSGRGVVTDEERLAHEELARIDACIAISKHVNEALALSCAIALSTIGAIITMVCNDFGQKPYQCIATLSWVMYFVFGVHPSVEAFYKKKAEERRRIGVLNT